ncbi:hypothetical protein K3495_g9726 [Podosphaera aphanis]|nr:hypothetical protein K3495_g9726 [Podosphaera aphanis]
MQIQFRANPSAFPSEKSRILYAGQVSFATFVEFLEALRAASDDPDSYATAEPQLQLTRQKTSCAAYYARIVSIFALLGWADPKVQIYHFRKGSKETLKDALVGRKMSSTFTEFATECIQLDNEMFARSREKKKLAQPSQHPSRPISSLPIKSRPIATIQSQTTALGEGDPMELDNSEAGRAARKAYRRVNNLCGYCGQPGHRVAVCPKLAAKSSRLANLEAEVDNSSPGLIILPHVPFQIAVPVPLSSHNTLATMSHNIPPCYPNDSGSPPSSRSRPHSLFVHTFDLGNENLLAFTFLQGKIPTNTMVDSGASNSFTDESFIQENHLVPRKKKFLETVRVVDGRKSSSGQITHEIDLLLQINYHTETLTFQVTKIARYEVILGKSWLSKHDPEIK